MSIRRPRKRISRAARPKRSWNINRVERRRAKLSPEHHVERTSTEKVYHSDNHKYNYDEEETKDDYSCLLNKQNLAMLIEKPTIDHEQEIICRLGFISL